MFAKRLTYGKSSAKSGSESSCKAGSRFSGSDYWHFACAGSLLDARLSRQMFSAHCRLLGLCCQENELLRFQNWFDSFSDCNDYAFSIVQRSRSRYQPFADLGCRLCWNLSARKALLMNLDKIIAATRTSVGYYAAEKQHKNTGKNAAVAGESVWASAKNH